MKVYAVYRNGDLTEGRGPMILDSIWSTKELAINYMDGKPGVMGRVYNWSQFKYGDWEVEEIEIDVPSQWTVKNNL